MTLRKAALAILGTLCLGVFFPLPSPASTTSSSFGVNVSNSNYCAINSISAPPTVSTIGGTTPGQVSGSISVTCTVSDAYNVEMNAGIHGTDSNTPTRYVANGSYQDGYNIYRDSGDTQPWGDYAGTNTYAATGSGSAQGFTFYVKVNAPPLTIPSGTYTDTITVTVAY